MAPIHTLADKDFVINALRILGEAADITDSIPPYIMRPPGKNHQTDILGHGLQEIYLNRNFDTATHIDHDIRQAFNTLLAPEEQGSSGFFTINLTWDGSGDVDLHTYEPNGQHVYYRHPSGTTGYLDIDNTDGFGPEHYYASCNPEKIQTGIYHVSVANFARAFDRVATVQVSTDADGVLGTRQVTLGSASGSYPTNRLFKIQVDRDSRTGKLTARILN